MLKISPYGLPLNQQAFNKQEKLFTFINIIDKQRRDDRALPYKTPNQPYTPDHSFDSFSLRAFINAWHRAAIVFFQHVPKW